MLCDQEGGHEIQHEDKDSLTYGTAINQVKISGPERSDSGARTRKLLLQMPYLDTSFDKLLTVTKQAFQEQETDSPKLPF